jgi:hypothetical protein
MNHPMYDAGYSMTSGLITLAFASAHIWGPFVVLLLIVSILGFVISHSRGTPEKE